MDAISLSVPPLKNWRFLGSGASKTATVRMFDIDGKIVAEETLTIGASATQATGAIWTDAWSNDWVGMQVLTASATIYAMPTTGTPEVTSSNGIVLAPGMYLGIVPSAVKIAADGSSKVTTGKVAAITTLLNTELDALVTTGVSALGTAFDNSQGLYNTADFELVVVAGSNFTAAATVDLYIVPALDGTNYGDSTPNVTHFAGNFVLRAATSERLVITCRIPPCLFKIQVVNNSGRTLNGSGANSVKMVPSR